MEAATANLSGCILQRIELTSNLPDGQIFHGSYLGKTSQVEYHLVCLLFLRGIGVPERVHIRVGVFSAGRGQSYL